MENALNITAKDTDTDLPLPVRPKRISPRKKLLPSTGSKNDTVLHQSSKPNTSTISEKNRSWKIQPYEKMSLRSNSKTNKIAEVHKPNRSKNLPRIVAVQYKGDQGISKPLRRSLRNSFASVPPKSVHLLKPKIIGTHINETLVSKDKMVAVNNDALMFTAQEDTPVKLESEVSAPSFVSSKNENVDNNFSSFKFEIPAEPVLSKASSSENNNTYKSSPYEFEELTSKTPSVLLFSMPRSVFQTTDKLNSTIQATETSKRLFVFSAPLSTTDSKPTKDAHSVVSPLSEQPQCKVYRSTYSVNLRKPIPAKRDFLPPRSKGSRSLSTNPVKFNLPENYNKFSASTASAVLVSDLKALSDKMTTNFVSPTKKRRKMNDETSAVGTEKSSLVISNLRRRRPLARPLVKSVEDFELREILKRRREKTDGSTCNTDK